VTGIGNDDLIYLLKEWIKCLIVNGVGAVIAVPDSTLDLSRAPDRRSWIHSRKSKHIITVLIYSFVFIFILNPEFFDCFPWEHSSDGRMYDTV
jgi:hypothetical protein